MIASNYSLEEAAEILRCRKRYLEDNLKRFPHQKIGQAVAFDDDEIAAIKDMHRVQPPEAATVQSKAPAEVSDLARIRPKGRRRVS